MVPDLAPLQHLEQQLWFVGGDKIEMVFKRPLQVVFCVYCPGIEYYTKFFGAADPVRIFPEYTEMIICTYYT